MRVGSNCVAIADAVPSRDCNRLVFGLTNIL